MIESRGLASSVRLEGFTPDLQERLAEAGVFVLSSRFEGFPMVLIEAMSAGTPVVTYDCPTGPAELVTDDVDGLLVEPESVPGLAEALSRLLADPAQRQRLGGAARARVAELALDRVAARWEQVLAGLPGGSDSPGAVGEGAASQPEAPNCSTRIPSARMPDSPSSRWANDANPTEPHT
jgi:glycosyltransferase involved in cell wall biosynthesis